MTESRQGTKPAETPQPFGIPRLLGAGLYLLFSFVLLVPLVRRWRRKRWWLALRGVLLLVGILTLCAWVTGRIGALAGLAGGMSLGFGVWLGPLTDPEFERKLQRRHRADYLLNGGVLAEGRLSGSRPLLPEQPLYLLIRSPHLIVVPQRGDGEMRGAIDIRRIARIEVGGELYVPTYVSEAKDPPVREQTVDQKASTQMTLTLDDSARIGFHYQGAFHKHLAETAAHGIYSVRVGLMSASAPPLPVLRIS